MLYIPESIRRFLPEEQYTYNNIGCSGASVLMFDEYVLKIEKDTNMSANELNMMRWLKGKLPAPEVVAADCVDGMRYLLMTRMEGHDLCKSEILDDQMLLAEFVADGLRKMWAVDITDCPTSRLLDDKFKEIEEGLRGGWITMAQARQPETYGPGGFESPGALFDWLVQHRPEEIAVFSHGDYCLPNIFAKEKQLRGYIDLGLSGIADPWVDIEQVLWSMWANTTGVFGGPQRSFDQKLLFEALDMDPDAEKLKYYSLLSELC